jgi:hypothetical protein
MFLFSVSILFRKSLFCLFETVLMLVPVTYRVAGLVFFSLLS